MTELRVTDRLHDRFGQYVETNQITVRRGPLIGETNNVCTIGSCFAREIRFALRDLGIGVSPHYARLVFDKTDVRVDMLPEEEHMNFYNAFTVMQEFERAFGLWIQDEDDYWTLNSRKFWRGADSYQDPYRRMVIGRTPALLRAVTMQINDIIRDAILSADAFLITYGMTEVFRNKRSGRIAAQKPLYGGGGGESETEFWQSSFEDNLHAIRRTVDLILKHNSGAKIFVTVSPVALERTFSGKDIYVANSEGKATLRAVLAQISREFRDVTYFPAYEMIMSAGAASFADDGRHVLVPTVQAIMRAFIAAHTDTGAPSQSGKAGDRDGLQSTA